MSMQWATAAHEIGHALGMHHEHARPDRDDHVTVDFNNIEPDKEGNFVQTSISAVTCARTPYDLGSIMHYSGMVGIFTDPT